MYKYSKRAEETFFRESNGTFAFLFAAFASSKSGQKFAQEKKYHIKDSKEDSNTVIDENF